MYYPLRKPFTVYLTIKLFWYKKTVRLEIQQATIAEIVEFLSLDETRKRNYILLKLTEWGAGKYAERLLNFLGDKIEDVLKDTFFFKREMKKLPPSVVALATREGIYDYDVPDSVIFGTITTETPITPHELLTYTLDEMYNIFEYFQYKNLNENQKKELQRIKKAQEMMAQKPMLDAKIAELEDYFSKNQ